jgi:predicted dehydrogenase
MRTPVSVGIVGLDHDGLELTSAFEETSGTEVRWLCDRNGDRRHGSVRYHHGARVTPSVDDLLADDRLDAVVVATAAAARAQIARRALAAGKHVFIHGPAALVSSDAWQLARDAERSGRVVSIADRVLFHPALRRLKHELGAGSLGEVFYLAANSQCFHEDRGLESLLWSLGASDVSAVLDLLGDQPIEVTACGESYVDEGIEDVVFCSLKFATGVFVHLHLSWLAPVELRRLTLVGSRRMAVFEPDAARALTLHDVTFDRRRGLSRVRSQARKGDVVAPHLAPEDPLRAQCDDFVRAVRAGAASSSAARQAAVVVDVLEALQGSLGRGGAAEPFVAARVEAADAAVIPLAARGDR